MEGGWRHRLAGVVGVAALSVLAVAVANHPLVQAAYGILPLIGHLPFETPARTEFLIEAGTTTLVVVWALYPLYKPRPRRVVDVALLAGKRTSLALFALAAIGYFDYTYRLPRATLLVAGGLLLVTVPAWFVTIRRRPDTNPRTILVGDDPSKMETVLEALDGPVLGYVAPPNSLDRGDQSAREVLGVADGGFAEDVDRLEELSLLGGLSRLDDVLVDYDVDDAVLAFRNSDRGEFFGTLDTCYEHGVEAKVHRDHADSVLIDGLPGEQLVTIDLEPWDWQDYAVKRAFDVAFASAGILLLAPLMLVLAVAIKLESPGPALYSHERTAEFGETFPIYKFRTMEPGAESETGATVSREDAGNPDPRVTSLGRILRTTHLDESPQLWSILRGQMSVVGPRPERPELDANIERGVVDWRRRWFVKPGLTGLAQVNDVTGAEPAKKLQYDLRYIREQSFWFDVKIVVRQFLKLVEDIQEDSSKTDW